MLIKPYKKLDFERFHSWHDDIMTENRNTFEDWCEERSRTIYSLVFFFLKFSFTAIKTVDTV